MKRGKFVPLKTDSELMQAVRAVHRQASAPTVGEEGYDPHVEHREYERLKEEMRRTKEELERVKNREKALEAAVNTPNRSRRDQDSAISWKRAIVLSEILGTPRSRKK